MSQTIINNRVHCPTCQTSFEVNRKSEGGADYARAWHKVTPRHVEILAFMLRYHNEPKTKQQLWRAFNGITLTSPSAFGGRISELIACGLIKQHHKDGLYTYTISLERATFTINHGGQVY